MDDSEGYLGARIAATLTSQRKIRKKERIRVRMREGMRVRVGVREGMRVGVGVRMRVGVRVVGGG